MTATELHLASAKIKGKYIASYNREITVKSMTGCRRSNRLRHTLSISWFFSCFLLASFLERFHLQYKGNPARSKLTYLPIVRTETDCSRVSLSTWIPAKGPKMESHWNNLGHRFFPEPITVARRKEYTYWPQGEVSPVNLLAWQWGGKMETMLQKETRGTWQAKTVGMGRDSPECSAQSLSPPTRLSTGLQGFEFVEPCLRVPEPTRRHILGSSIIPSDSNAKG